MIAAARRVVIDVGAGDGLASLRAARADPSVLAIALDPSTDRLRIGARAALRGKIANVLFVVARIEDAPCELEGAADHITVSFPWGSLLRGLVRAEPQVLRPLARVAKPGASVDVLISVEARDAGSGVAAYELDAVGSRHPEFAACGLVLQRVCIADEDQIAGSGSSWAKRLGRARRVSALTLRCERE